MDFKHDATINVYLYLKCRPYVLHWVSALWSKTQFVKLNMFSQLGLAVRRRVEHVDDFRMKVRMKEMQCLVGFATLTDLLFQIHRLRPATCNTYSRNNLIIRHALIHSVSQTDKQFWLVYNIKMYKV